MSIELIDNTQLGEDDDERWFWHVKGENGEILAHSETYSSRQAAEKGIAAAKKAMTGKPKVFSNGKEVK